MESDQEEDIRETDEEKEVEEKERRERVRKEREELERVEVEREMVRDVTDESEEDEIDAEEKVRREHVKLIIPRMLPKKRIEELVEAVGSADDDYELEVLEQRIGYSNDADQRAFAEADEIKQKKRRRVGNLEYHPEDMEESISQVADAFTVHINGVSNAPDLTEAPLQGRVYYLPGTESEHLTSADEGAPQPDVGITATQHLVATVEGAQQQGAVDGTQHVAKQDEAKQDGKRPKLTVRIRLRGIEPIKHPADELDARDHRAAVRPAFARDELQPGDIDDDEALEIALRQSMEENRKERKRRQKDPNQGAESESQPIRGMREEDEAIRIAVRRSEAEASTCEAAKGVEHHDQDAEQEQEDEAAITRRRRTGKDKLDSQ